VPEAPQSTLLALLAPCRLAYLENYTPFSGSVLREGTYIHPSLTQC
jgi:hypothetical protein